MTSLPETKVCTKCHEEKPLDDFGKRNDTKDGRRSQCRLCRNEVNNTWQRTDKAKEASRSWRKANRDKTSEYEKRYWGTNPEKLKEKRSRSSKVWRERYPEKSRAKTAKWRAANPEKTREINKRSRDNSPGKSMRDWRTRRARLSGVISEKYTEQDVLTRWGANCHICGEEVDLTAPRSPGVSGWERGLHLDHVIPLKEKGPDVIENVKPSHGLCNLKKN
jgi:hypothetical protein